MLQQIAQGMVNCMMDRGDAAKPMMRAAARELLTTCVLRPVVHLFTPYNINKVRHCWRFAERRTRCSVLCLSA